VPNLDAPEIRERLAGSYLQSMGLLFESPGAPRAALPASAPPPQKPAALPKRSRTTDMARATTRPTRAEKPLPWDDGPGQDGIWCEECGTEITETKGRKGRRGRLKPSKATARRPSDAASAPAASTMRKEDADMNNSTITITLERDDWVSIGKDLTANLGKMVNIMPTARLLESLTKSGIQTSELDPKGGH
jgi:hypothetical protein